MQVMQLVEVAQEERLKPLSGEINSGEIIHLVGPNGAGKSTLLGRMAGMTFGAGEIRLQTRSLREWSPGALAHRRSYLVQQQMPPFAMPVWHYLQLHQPKGACASLLEAVADALSIGDKLTRSARALSGGEWQRVRLAAAILQIHPAAAPEGCLLLLDEPMSGLDVAQQAALDRLLSQLARQGIAVVMSSHDLNHTLRHAHRVWLLAKGELLASGSRDSVLTPHHLDRAYGIHFHRLELEGHRMLISAAPQ